MLALWVRRLVLKDESVVIGAGDVSMAIGAGIVGVAINIIYISTMIALMLARN